MKNPETGMFFSQIFCLKSYVSIKIHMIIENPEVIKCQKPLFFKGAVKDSSFKL